MLEDGGRMKEAVEQTRDTAGRAYEGAKDYAKTGGVYAAQFAGRVASFVQEEPWLAMAGAFILGYVAAQIVKRAK